jgi:hypothetical protein
MVANSGIGSFMLTDASESTSDLSILPGIVTNIQGDRKFRNDSLQSGRCNNFAKKKTRLVHKAWGKKIETYHVFNTWRVKQKNSNEKD